MGSYDCSGSTDFVLYNAGLNSPQVDVGNRIAGDSTLLETYGSPGPATGSPSTPAPTTPSSRSPESFSTPPTGHQPPHPAPDPAGNPHQPSPNSSPKATAGPDDTPQDYDHTGSATAVKRSLLAAAGVLAIASAAMQPATNRTGTHARAAAGTGSAAVIAEPTRSPRSTPSAQPRTVAATVAQADARYLDGQLPAQRLPPLTPQALATARNSGPLPTRLHLTQVRLTSLTGAGDSWTAHFAIIDIHGRQTTTARLVLSATDGPWKLAELIPPDPDILITPTPRPPPCRPPAPPLPAARRSDSPKATSTTPTTIPSPASSATSPPSCEPRSPPTRRECWPTSAHCAPASQDSRSHAMAHAGWQTRT